MALSVESHTGDYTSTKISLFINTLDSESILNSGIHVSSRQKWPDQSSDEVGRDQRELPQRLHFPFISFGARLSDTSYITAEALVGRPVVG